MSEKEETPVVIIHPASDPDFDGTMLNSKFWDRIVVTTTEGKKVAEINTDDATPATGYLVKAYPHKN
ncbi:hypothetical protein [Lactiplantibacillus plantarum]|uniref:hypothetical protein n=1 Tax=Lactiplantibacillus plantarum TaxID=1590 RepID=UPI000B41A061|nr:hypothetical protein [Lactiplantibacillus plantarum]